jgi:lysozyme
MKLKPFLIILAVIGILGIVGAYIGYRIFIKPKGIEVSRKVFEVQGIDISKHCGKVDFEKLNNSNVDFIFIKATEGISHVDRKFKEFSKQSSDFKKPIGYYHFFRFNRPGKAQAIHFWNNIKDKRYELPLCIDVEEWGNNSNTPVNKIEKNVREFIKYIENKTGKKILIYSNENSYKKYLKKEFKNNPVWICSFNQKNLKKYNWEFWQFSHKGKVEGVDEYVDLNAFNGNREQWEDFINR